MLDSVIDKNASTGGAHCSDAEIDTLGLQSGFSLIPSKLTPVFFFTLRALILCSLKMGGNEVLVIQGATERMIV